MITALTLVLLNKVSSPEDSSPDAVKLLAFVYFVFCLFVAVSMDLRILALLK